MRQCDWWSKDWNFVKQDEEQIYIAHSSWRKKTEKPEYSLWIGVEAFNPSGLFGKYSGQHLYLWVNREPSLMVTLRALVADKKIVLPGEVVDRPTGYIVRKFIPKVLPNEVARMGDVVRPIIIQFFTECANNEPALTRAMAKIKM